MSEIYRVNVSLLISSQTRKTYIKSSLSISIAPVIGLRSIIQQALISNLFLIFNF